MQIHPSHQQQASGSRFPRGQVHVGAGRRYALEGDARPGDVLALAGGALVRDRNENGLIDGHDAPLRGVDALVVGSHAEGRLRGGLVDVRG